MHTHSHTLPHSLTHTRTLSTLSTHTHSLKLAPMKSSACRYAKDRKDFNTLKSAAESAKEKFAV